MQIARSRRVYDHCDKDNVGLSLVTANDKYTGGFFYSEGKVLDVHGKVAIFDGAKPHEVSDVEGDRSSIVAFTHSMHADLSCEMRLKLQRMGFPLPFGRSAKRKLDEVSELPAAKKRPKQPEERLTKQVVLLKESDREVRSRLEAAKKVIYRGGAS